MAAFMGRTVSISLPAIQAEFGAAVSQLQWVITVYALVLATFTLISGRMCDAYGTRGVFLGGIGLFGAGAVAAAASGSMAMLIASQVVLGLGGMLMLPACLALINLTFAEDHKGAAIGLWAGVGAAFGVLGLLTGGLVVEVWGWRGGFWLLAPLAGMAWLLARRSVPPVSSAGSRQISLGSSLALAAGLLGLAYALINGPGLGWGHPAVVAGGAAAAAGAALFRRAERVSPTPLVPHGFVASSGVFWPNAVTFFLYFALNGLYVFLIVFFQEVFGLPPSRAGMGLLPPSLAVMLLSGWFGRQADRRGARGFIVAGTGLTALGMAWVAAAPAGATYLRHFLPPLLTIGLGMALFVAPLTKLAVAVRDEHSGVASGLNNTVARVSGLLAMALLGGVLATAFGQGLDGTGLSSVVAEALQQQPALGTAVLPADLSPDEGAAIARLVAAARLGAYHWTMGVNAAFAGVSFLLSAVMLKRGGYTDMRGSTWWTAWRCR